MEVAAVQEAKDGRIGSEAERVIRYAVADYARTHLPGARIVHELVTGGCRADVAAVQRDRLTLFEIKSERDKLDRLKRQMREFRTVSHEAVLVAHIKWFDQAPYDNGAPRISAPDELDHHGKHRLWCFPETDLSQFPTNGFIYSWKFNKPDLCQPRALTFLHLMWRAEMLAEARRHRVDVTSRMNMWTIAQQMAWHMTGKEIAEAVCRQLRGREFPEADPPIRGTP